MRYKINYRTRGRISIFLIVCLIISAVYTDKAAVVLAESNSSMKVLLKIGNQTVSGKTISVKKGKRKNIKVTVPKKEKYKITFRSNRPRLVSVSKTGKLTAKKTGTAKITVTAKIENKKYKSWIKIRVVSSAKQGENASDTENVLDMYNITVRANGRAFSAKLYKTKTTEAFMQKLPLSITMNELNGNEKYYYFSENFPTESQKVSRIHAGDLKLYGSSCLVFFYESFSTSYRYTSLGYVENPEGLAEALGAGSVKVEIVE